MGFFPPVFRYKRLFYLMVPIVVELAFFENFNPAGLLGPDVKKPKRRWDVANLARLLDHKDPQVQYEAAEALGNLGDERAIDPLIAALKRDEFSGVRGKAAEALSKIGDRAVGPLIAALKRSDTGIRWGSALALGKIKNPLAVEPLILLLADEHLLIKAEAASGLASIGTPALSPLQGFLKSAKGETRREVMTALEELRNADAVDAILLPAVESLVRRIRNGNPRNECNRH